MTAIEWDLDDLGDIPFEGGGLVPVVPTVYVNSHTHKGAGTPTAKKCRCCENPVYSPFAVYCSRKSTCRSRYHRNPARYVQQTATGVASVASLSPDEFIGMLLKELTALIGGSSRAIVVPAATTVKPPKPDIDLLESIEIRKDESAAARCSNNLRNTLMAMYNGEGAWAKLGATT